MAYISEQLSFSEEPHSDESFLGYILRLAEINRYEHLVWILQLAGIVSQSTSKPASAFLPEASISSLSKLTGVDLPKLGSLLYPATKNGKKRMAFRVQVFDQPVAKHYVRPGRPKVCPSCLRNDGDSPYIRKLWELTPVTACPFHKCLLLDECPNCRKPITWRRSFVCNCACKYDWRLYQQDEVGHSEVLVSARIFRLCNLMSDAHTSKLGFGENNPLYSIDLSAFLSVICFVAGQYQGVLDLVGRNLAHLKRTRDVHDLLCRAYSVFDSWPNNYFSFLDWCRSNIPDRRYTHGLSRDFNWQKYALYKQLTDSNYTFMREAFEEYILRHWDGGYVSAVKRISSTLETRTYLSLAEASNCLNLTKQSIKGLVAAGTLAQAENQQDSNRPVLIDAKSVFEFKKELQTSLYLRQVAIRLGVHDRRIYDLMEVGLLTPLRGSTIDGYTDWKFSSSRVDSLLLSLYGRVCSDQGTHNGKKIKLEGVLRALKNVDVKFGVLIKDILNGFLTPCGRSDESGISGLTFFISDVHEYRTRKLRDVAGEVLSIREAARNLSISVVSIYALVEAKVLSAVIIPEVKLQGLLVRRADLEQFDSTYISLRQIAAQTKSKQRRVRKFLQSRGVTGICGFPNSTKLVGMFRRTEVLRVGLTIMEMK
jgi:hypothetical protein